MSCVQEVAAHEQNAADSSGPDTTGAEADSQPRGPEHLLSPAGFAVADEFSQLIAQRLNDWRGRFDFRTAEDEWVFSQYVIGSVRIDRCVRDEPIVRAYSALRAELSWDEDRRLDAEELAVRLSRRPALVVRRLKKTRQGCEWLLDRWRELATALEDGAEWTEQLRSLAFDLLSAPASARHRDPWPEGGSARELARREIEGLEGLKARVLDRLDALEREAARRGAPVHLPRPLARLFWYEATCVRRLSWARAILQPCRPAPPKQPEPSPQPSPESEPEPRVQPRDLADRTYTQPSGEDTTRPSPPVRPSPAPSATASAAESGAKATLTVPAPAQLPEPLPTAFVPIRVSDCVKPAPVPMSRKARRAARRKAAKGRS
jgi:hypothetical protein